MKMVRIGIIVLLSVIYSVRLFAQEPGKPLFQFGIVSDTQFGDKENQGVRHYRFALKLLREAVDTMNRHRPAFVIQLGDLIDGHSEDMDKTVSDLDTVLGVYKHLATPLYHVIGNHCMVAGQEVLQEKLNLKRFYYDFSVDAAPDFHFIVLDGNDAGYGVMGSDQLSWFDSVLREADKQQKKVVVFCHYALLKEAANRHRMAQPGPVLKLIDERNCVIAWFAGHDHQGGYALRNGVHHVTFKGMVEAKKNAYALIELYPEKMIGKGFGEELSRELFFTEKDAGALD